MTYIYIERERERVHRHIRNSTWKWWPSRQRIGIGRSQSSCWRKKRNLLKLKGRKWRNNKGKKSRCFPHQNQYLVVRFPKNDDVQQQRAPLLMGRRGWHLERHCKQQWWQRRLSPPLKKKSQGCPFNYTQYVSLRVKEKREEEKREIPNPKIKQLNGKGRG